MEQLVGRKRPGDFTTTGKLIQLPYVLFLACGHRRVQPPGFLRERDVLLLTDETLSVLFSPLLSSSGCFPSQAKPLERLSLPFNPAKPTDSF